MKVTEEQRQVLKKYIEDIDTLIGEDNVQILLDAIDDEIVSNILENDDEPSEDGIKLQKIYDQIYNQN